MAVRIEDNCVGCPDGVPCFGSACPYLKVSSLVCDECGEKADKLHKVFGGDMELCENCAKKEISAIAQNSLTAEEYAECLKIDMEVIK